MARSNIIPVMTVIYWFNDSDIRPAMALAYWCSLGVLLWQWSIDAVWKLYRLRYFSGQLMQSGSDTIPSYGSGLLMQSVSDTNPVVYVVQWCNLWGWSSWTPLQPLSILGWRGIHSYNSPSLTAETSLEDDDDEEGHFTVHGCITYGDKALLLLIVALPRHVIGLPHPRWPRSRSRLTRTYSFCSENRVTVKWQLKYPEINSMTIKRRCSVRVWFGRGMYRPGSTHPTPPTVAQHVHNYTYIMS